MNLTSRKIVIIVGFFCIISFPFILYSLIKNNANKINEEELKENRRLKRDEDERRQYEEQLRDEQEKEEQKKEEQRRKIIEEQDKIHEENKHINDNILDNILKNGFIENSDNEKCLNYERCFSNGVYNISYQDNGYIRVTFKKKIDRTSLKTYDSLNDLKFIDNLYGKEYLSTLYEGINLLINSFSLGYSSNFNININGMYVYVSCYSDSLEFTISPELNIVPLDYNFSYLDTIINENKYNADKTYILKKQYYDFAMSYNKKYFKFYDIAYNYFNNNSINICDINFSTKNYYSFESSFCHGGSSDTSFSFSYDDRLNSNYDTVLVDVKGEYFKKAYLEIIKKDLAYFQKKLGKKFDLTKNIENQIKTYVDNNQENFELTISDGFTIKIKYNYSYYYKDYQVSYIIS